MVHPLAHLIFFLDGPSFSKDILTVLAKKVVYDHLAGERAKDILTIYDFS